MDHDGKEIWANKKALSSPIIIANDHLYFQAPSRFLQAVGSAGETILDKAPFPGAMGSRPEVNFMWALEKELIAVMQDTAPAERSRSKHDGDEEQEIDLSPNKIVVIKNRFEITYGDYHKHYKGKLRLKTLFHPVTNELLLTAGQQVILLNIKTEKEIAQFLLPIETPIDWSLGKSQDSKDMLVALGYHEKSKVVIAMDISAKNAGQKFWQWTDSDVTDKWSPVQPPIQAKGGRVYALSEHKVIAIENGKLIWSYAADALRHGTVLEDRSLLITAGKSLQHIGANGEKIFSINTTDDILSPPVVDAEGHIYIATSKQVLRVD